ncbi:MAG: Stk1 family PASTA domain-containing Ser/Thr kinase [Anaerolineales bacterium]
MEPTVLNQRYRLVELVGSGGMATVYRGEDVLLERDVAVKFLREPYASEPEFRERFLHEARAAARLDHPNIVHIYDVGEDARRPYIVMEMVKGEDLKALIRRESPLPVSKALDLIEQICAGVGHAHRAGLVHCDLKPQNILVTPDETIKVADFGIARAFQYDVGQAETDEDEEEQVIWGSPHYISPEQVAGKTPTPASDVYSIGVMLYEMLTGVPPFHDPDPTVLAMKHLQEQPAPLTALNPRVPPGLEWLVRKVLAKEPAQRYRNADQLGISVGEYRRQGIEATRPQQSISQEEVATPTPPPTQSRPQPAPPKRTSEPEAQSPPQTRDSGPDWMLWALMGVAAIAVLGLIPLWLFVYQAYTQDNGGPLPPAITNGETPTSVVEEQMVSVPNLVGLGLADGRRLVESLDLEIEVLGEQESNEARPGEILEQTPNSGNRVPIDSTVSVIVARGQALTLPDVVGYDLDVVQEGLESEGLLLNIERVWSTESEGKILAQEPSPESEIRSGSTVTLTVSGGVNLPIPLGVNLGNRTVLEEARLLKFTYQPGENIPVTLRWRCVESLDHSYKVFVHLLTADMGTLITQHDVEPMNGLRPTQTWQPGEIINDPHQLSIPEGTPPGTYQIRVGMYDEAGRLPVVEAGEANVIDSTILVAEIVINP